MKSFKKYSMISALLVLLSLSCASQADTVLLDLTQTKSGLLDGPLFGVSGNLDLVAGNEYTMDLGAFSFDLPGGTAAGFIGFALALGSESHLISLLSGNGTTSLTFEAGQTGAYTWLVGGFAAELTTFNAKVTDVTAPVPLPSSVIMLGTALAAMVSIGRRGMTRRVQA